MTDEFLKKLKEANEKAIKVYNKQDEKYLKKCEENKKYIDLYIELVLAFVENYDYKNGVFKFDPNEIINKYYKIIGFPDRINAFTHKNEAILGFHYSRNRDLSLNGLPDKKIIDFNIVNDVLAENGISVKEDLWDGGERGSDEYIVKFDATILNETRDKLMNETENAKKMILKIEKEQ
jgi:hypothetical protein